MTKTPAEENKGWYAQWKDYRGPVRVLRMDHQTVDAVVVGVIGGETRPRVTVAFEDGTIAVIHPRRASAP